MFLVMFLWRQVRKNPTAAVVIAMFLIVLGFAASYSAQLKSTRNHLVDVSYSRDSAIASSDSTRREGDIFMHRAIQTAQERDSISKALDTERRVKAKVHLEIPRVETDGVTVARVTPDTVVMTWSDLYSAPYTVDARVSYVPKDSNASLVVGVKLDPIPLTIRLECGVPLDGVRPATLLAQTTLPLLRIVVDSVSQSREVCAAQVPAYHTRRVSATKVAGAASLFGAIVGFLIARK
jgi:hypothetical protein